MHRCDYLNGCFLFIGCKILSLGMHSVCITSNYRHLTPGVCPGNVNEVPNGVIYDDVDERDDTYMYADSPNKLKAVPSENESKSSICDDNDDDEIELIADSFDSDTTCDFNEERPSIGSDLYKPTHTS